MNIRLTVDKNILNDSNLCRITGFNKYFSNNFSQAEDWQPLVIYRNSLVHGEGEVPTVTSKRPYGRKRRYDDDESEEEDDLNDPNYR